MSDLFNLDRCPECLENDLEEGYAPPDCGWGPGYFLQCCECGHATKPYPTKAEAITAWNCRAQQEIVG